MYCSTSSAVSDDEHERVATGAYKLSSASSFFAAISNYRYLYSSLTEWIYLTISTSYTNIIADLNAWFHITASDHNTFVEN